MNTTALAALFWAAAIPVRAQAVQVGAVPSAAGIAPAVESALAALGAPAGTAAAMPPALSVKTPPSAAVIPPKSAAPVFDARGAARSWTRLLSDLATARVIGVGEAHDDAEDHKMQAEILAVLAARTPNLAVAFEMVGFEDQAVLDSFMSGKRSEASFAFWWNSNWGHDFYLYKPIFDAAKAAGVPAYGLNAPRELVEAVSKGGLASLSPSDRARLPFLIRESDDERYRDYVKVRLAGHGKIEPRQLKNRAESMAVWNETMGEKAAAIAASGRVVFVIAGFGHTLYRAGLLESAARRGAGPVRALLPMPAVPKGEDLGLSDWFFVVPPYKAPRGLDWLFDAPSTAASKR